MSTWLRDGRLVYELNDKGVNRWSASVQDAHTPEAELIEVARLIAAAPELLEALRAVLYKYVADGSGTSDGDMRAYNEASAAIKKATGDAKATGESS